MATQRTAVDVEGRHLTLSNLDKVLFPEPGTTKRDVLAYYTEIAPFMLPHLHRRPVTFRRAPDGMSGGAFYEKHVPKGSPDWFSSVRVPSNGRATGSGAEGGEWIDAPSIDSLPALIWAANLAVIEFHVPMWMIGRRGEPRRPDLLVFDLDPGPGAGMPECCRTAELVRSALADDGLTALAKTSGSKGLQLYCRVPARRPAVDTLDYARSLAVRLEREHPDDVVSNMRKDLRHDKVLIDWSQNNTSKTTVAPYSLRLLPVPTASTPVSWDEVAGAAGGQRALRFTGAEVVARVQEMGDLFAPLVARR